MKPLLLERLTELILYDKETGRLFWKKRTSNRVKVGQEITNNIGRYIGCRIDGIGYRVHHLIWMFEYGVLPTGVIDHIDGNPRNNVITNLRIVTQSVNGHNRPIMNNRSSGYSGVYRRGNRYRAVIRVSGTQKMLGTFDTPEEAYAAYILAKKTLFPEIHESMYP